MKEPWLVLYAEDDPHDAFFMQRAFKKLERSDSLKRVEDGLQAIDYLEGKGAFADRTQFPLPGLLILDVKMPRRSGLEVLAWVRGSSAFAETPVILFTSSTQGTDIEFARMYRADAYLAKPANAEQLSQLVSSVLETKGARPEIARLPGNLLRPS